MGIQWRRRRPWWERESAHSVALSGTGPTVRLAEAGRSSCTLSVTGFTQTFELKNYPVCVAHLTIRQLLNTLSCGVVLYRRGRLREDSAIQALQKVATSSSWTQRV